MTDQIVAQDKEKIKNAVNPKFFNQKSILVTGGAGFIGSWLCEVLVDFGAQVTCVDDFSTGRMKNVEHLLTNEKFNLVKGKARNFKSKTRLDMILHLAGHASPDEYQVHPIETLRTSALGTEVMAKLALKNDAPLMFSSTSEVYGDAEIVPTPETYWGKVNSIGIRSCYDEGKRYAEALLMAYAKQKGLDVRVPRIFNTYGPRLREDGFYGRAMSRFINQALSNKPITVYGDGKQTRSFCYVTDMVTALLLLLENKEAKDQVVNVGNNQEITVLQLAEKIEQVTKSKSQKIFLPLPQDDPKRRCPDIGKLEKLIGWKPSVSLEFGLARTIEWFLLQQNLKQ
jgi:UDP-glucuronate decarboxylase